LAVRSGIDAALAAQRGFIAEERILEADKGFFRVFGGVDAKGVTDGLGHSWDILTQMAVKLVPGGHPYHAFAEAAANAAREGYIAAEEIKSITISRPGLLRLSGPLHPKNLIEMAHSPAYFAAAGAADKTFSWIHASPEKIADPVIHQVIDKVRVGAPPTENADQYCQGATVTIDTTDGRSLTSTVYAPKGSSLLGIDWADIDAKYLILMQHSGLRQSHIDASLAAIHDFAEAPGVAPLIELTRPEA